ncbi:PDZ domain-containing protein [bacterium]|nr:PDZ domain-containing protein [bacterium]
MSLLNSVNHGDGREWNVGAQLKALLAIIVTAMGFVLGAVLAGVGGLSAKTLLSLQSKVESTKKIENYWQDTGLSMQDIKPLISNDKCYSSEKYFESCLNVVVENALNFKLKLSIETGQLLAIGKHDHLDEKTEKQLMEFYNGKVSLIDFEGLLQQLAELEQPAKKSMLAAKLINSFLSIYFDPHTYVLPANYYDEVSGKIARSKFFVGLSYEKINGEFYIKKIAKNSDAELAGLKLNDKIISINSEKLSDKGYAEVSNILKNEQTSKLAFEVERKQQIVNIELNRTYRELSHVQYNTTGTDKKYAVITLTKFNSGACGEISTRLKQANKENVKGLILDLRDNPGGQLNEAACIAGLFLGKDKKAYYVEYFDEDKSNEVVLTSDEKIYHGPMVVLVNSFSASASELLAGGLQDYKRALVVGERTFGKGTFQEPEQWTVKSTVSLFKTQGVYLLPSRTSTQLRGVIPDVVLNAEADTRREDVVYFRPVKLKNNKTNKLRNSEIEKDFSFSSCKVQKNRSAEDIYLSQGIDYLGCVQKTDINLAQTEFKSIIQ